MADVLFETMNRKLTIELVRTEVRRFWQAFAQYDVRTINQCMGMMRQYFIPLVNALNWVLLRRPVMSGNMRALIVNLPFNSVKFTLFYWLKILQWQLTLLNCTSAM